MKALDLNGSGYIEQEEFVKLVEMVGGAVVDESGVIKYSLTLGAAQAQNLAAARASGNSVKLQDTVLPEHRFTHKEVINLFG